MIRAVLMGLLLSGCSTAIEVQRVEIPVPVSCVQRPMIPKEPGSKFAATSDASPVDEQVLALLVDRERYYFYSAKLRALLEACVTTEATTSTDRSE